MSDPQYPPHIEDEFHIVTSLIGGCRKVGDEWILPEGKTLPSQEEINAKREELKTDYDSKQYQRYREVAYPSIQDQLDKIYHSGLTAWKADIKAVKDKYPKP